MYQYLKIERIATPCCLIPNTSYFKKYFKRGRKQKSTNLVIVKLSRWFGLPTYSRCIAEWWGWTANVARTTPVQRNYSGVARWFSWSCDRGRWNSEWDLKPSKWFGVFPFPSARLVRAHLSEQERGGWPTRFPRPYPAHQHVAMRMVV